MERGLLWLPLLALFIGLAWAGWHEYQKLEAYNRWAADFDTAKYDIYAVLGQKGQEITWGKPTRREPIEIQQFSLQDVAAIRLWVNERVASWENPPQRGKTALEFEFKGDRASTRIPFTDPTLAARWGKHLDAMIG
ncbi:MAG: hypothetical protein SAJ12_07545 [Jaaginema sp. PMC 1079.18]|nr:hypothetical protein [Jaaginema sp. PMC 1080.18]MEC4850852.1 hypothetical protein [Jaaginema sp. PMC 1079.18]MEC4867270.1 hypothetical protein [Jaaginema sp. PMC 1078.18]